MILRYRKARLPDKLSGDLPEKDYSCPANVDQSNIDLRDALARPMAASLCRRRSAWASATAGAIRGPIIIKKNAVASTGTRPRYPGANYAKRN